MLGEQGSLSQPKSLAELNQTERARQPIAFDISIALIPVEGVSQAGFDIDMGLDELAPSFAAIEIDMGAAEPRLIGVHRRLDTEGAQQVDDAGDGLQQRIWQSQEWRPRLAGFRDQAKPLAIREIDAAEDIAFAGASALGSGEMGAGHITDVDDRQTAGGYGRQPLPASRFDDEAAGDAVEIGRTNDDGWIEGDDIQSLGDEIGGDGFGFMFGVGVVEAIGRQVEGIAFVGGFGAGADADGGGAAGEDDAADAGGLGGGQQIARAIDIDAPEGFAVVILPVVGFGGDMEDDIAIGAGGLQKRDIVEVAADGFNVEVFQLAQFAFGAVEGARAVAAFDEQAGEMRAEEAGGAGDEGFHAFSLPQSRAWLKRGTRDAAPHPPADCPQG